jgi:hypothetical protein
MIQQIQLLPLKQEKTVPADRIRELFHSFWIRFAFRTDSLWPPAVLGDPREISSIRRPIALLIS